MYFVVVTMATVGYGDVTPKVFNILLMYIRIIMNLY